MCDPNVKTKTNTSTNTFNAVKVFSTTLGRDREVMGDTITRWLAGDPSRQIVDVVVTQSSDQSFHCLSITVFYRTRH